MRDSHDTNNRYFMKGSDSMLFLHRDTHKMGTQVWLNRLWLWFTLSRWPKINYRVMRHEVVGSFANTTSIIKSLVVNDHAGDCLLSGMCANNRFLLVAWLSVEGLSNTSNQTNNRYPYSISCFLLVNACVTQCVQISDSPCLRRSWTASAAFIFVTMQARLVCHMHSDHMLI